jgi:hypothetical protein
VLQIGLLLGASQALALVGLGLLLARFIVLFGSPGLGRELLGNALRLGLLVRGGFGGSLGLRLLGLFGLLALDFRVLGGVPGV